MTHTPGPWVVDEELGMVPGHPYAILVQAGEGRIIADICWSNNAEANAHLIAAAPELLTTLKALWNAVQAFASFPPDSPMRLDIEGLIAKAHSKKEVLA